MNFLDLSIQEYFLGLRTPFLTDFFYFFTMLFDPNIYFIALVLVVALYINYYKNFRTTLLFLVTLFFTGAITLFLKMYFGTARPVNAMIQVFGNGFPSYHTAISVAFFFSLYYIFRDRILESRRPLIIALSTLFVILVSLSRLYFGVHWFSDILGGLVIGISMVWCLRQYLQVK